MNDLSLAPDLSEVFAKVSSSGRMTLQDCQHLRTVLLENQISDEEKQAIDRLLYAIRLGRIQVIEEPHA
ncbi:hypothetical protein [Leptolyngbya sp. NIES-2104]|uniref:hypothetical protein n=1 Tax=Leptolyngbya sp. NIES-2104 TaxID=1552121 RepID=UPI0006EC6A2F|nr:hypothetical protein [Leptolyngbya sp. NIES-2104]GAP95860.1 hypothetical protein NIES2104_23860 [Leptolyngbya sp. NIES-2104]